MPTGAGTYIVSAWAMQNQNETPAQNVALQVNLSCGEPAAGPMFPTIGQFGIHAVTAGRLDADQRHGEPGGQRGLPA